MSAPPYIPFFGADYLKDTQLLSVEEHGAYFLLMLTCWQQDDCSLPDDDRKLARICRVGPRKWKQIRPVMAEFWTIGGGRWTNNRLTKERKFAEGKSEAARENARKRWDAQTTENKQTDECESICDGNAAADANGYAPQPQPQREEPDGSSPPSSPRHFRGKDWPEIPDWIAVEPWNGFIEMRRRKRANPTARAVGMLITTLEKLRGEDHDPGAVLDQSTVKNWTDLYPIKDNRHGTANPPRDNRDGLDRALDRRLSD